ncbi:hypothetical protein [Lentzea sp. E54]|uniref:hypothetical protein n=1 Tax=Lentzea xerophila TaxID=3435883 RepID=UPI003DA1DCBE
MVSPDVINPDESLRLLRPAPALTVAFDDGRTCTVLLAAPFAGSVDRATVSGVFAHEATVDGITDLFPAGPHRIGPARPLYRIVLDTAARKSGDLQ